MFAKCLLRRFDCSLGEGIVLLFVVMASCVSGVSVNVLLRLCMCLQSLEGLVLYLSDSAEKLFPFNLLFILDIIRYIIDVRYEPAVSFLDCLFLG